MLLQILIVDTGLADDPRIAKWKRSTTAEQTRDIEPMLDQCWADVVDGGPTLNQHWFNVSCLLENILPCSAVKENSI